MAGMKESKEFAGELFDGLARKRNIIGNSITKSELREFWDQISDPSFDSRLQTFFDMYIIYIYLSPIFYSYFCFLFIYIYISKNPRIFSCLTITIDCFFFFSSFIFYFKKK